MTAPKDPMKAIWESVSQPGPDGQRRLRYAGRDDLYYLYETGFVDTDQFTIDQWIQAFQDSLQKDGSYLINEVQWMAKKKFRYNGPVPPPFDPHSLKDGEWNVEEFDHALEKTLLPELSLTQEQFRQLFQKAKEMNLAVNGKYQVDRSFKLGLKTLLDRYPSPKRLRALSVQKVREQPSSATPKPSSPKTDYQKGPSAEKTTMDELSRLIWKK